MGEEKQLSFDEELVTKYPRANRKIVLQVMQYGLMGGQAATETTKEEKGQTVYISPYGLQFQAPLDYPEGTLLKIHVSLPDYWTRKQRFVDYTRVDTPENFKILAKVGRTEDVGKRGKKKLVTAQTVNMDEVDEQVLKNFLQEG